MFNYFREYVLSGVSRSVAKLKTHSKSDSNFEMFDKTIALILFITSCNHLIRANEILVDGEETDPNVIEIQTLDSNVW